MTALKDLIQALLKCADEAEMQSLLEDLCTPKELESIAERWQVARLLEQEIPYREIYQRTGVSTATVTRVARALKEGRGYRLALNRQKFRVSGQGETNV